MERRLAAILAADIAGYSALMGADQDRTMEALRQFRSNLFEPTIDQHRGKVIKSMGDGWLVEYTSAVDAVSSAIELQDHLSEDAVINLRIGIHIGDVMHEIDDVFGDGVNVAARLEALVEPGGILISDAAYSSLDGRLRSSFADEGEVKLKNIDRQVRIWRRAGKSTSVPNKHAERPSIAVLPLANLSGDPSQDHIAEGISDEIINALARCRWLVVTARSSSFTYKGGSFDLRKVAQDLDVKYVLDGSLRRGGSRIRIAAQLIDGRTGRRLWGDRYDREDSDLFELQDEIAETIAGTVEPELSAIEGSALRDSSIDELTAWECFQRGLWHLYGFTIEDIETARAFFERAVRLDPNLAPAYARLAYAHIQLGFYGPHEKRANRLKDAIRLAHAAVKLDSRDPTARVSLGRALALQGDSRRAIEELRTAVALDPSFAQAHFSLGQALAYADEAEEALTELNEAIRLSPNDPHLWTFLNVRAVAHYIAGDLEAAAADERAALRQPNATFWPAMILTAILGRAGRLEEAAEAIEELHRFRPGMTCDDAMRELIFTDQPFNTKRFIAQFRADLLAAGMK